MAMEKHSVILKVNIEYDPEAHGDVDIDDIGTSMAQVVMDQFSLPDETMNVKKVQVYTFAREIGSAY